MEEPHKTQPHDDDRDNFDRIVGRLPETFIDPYLTKMHDEARLCEEIIIQQESGNPELTTDSREMLNAMWRYMDQEVEVSGQIWVLNKGEKRLAPRTSIGEAAISKGFIFHKTRDEDTGEIITKVAHSLSVQSSEGPFLIFALIHLDDIIEFKLPTPSPEAREQHFAYYHKDKAEQIDGIAFRSVRDDQVISDLRDFHFDVDFDNPFGVDSALNAAEYMRRRAEIEKFANYRIKALGEVILLDRGDMGGTPAELEEVADYSMHINDIVLQTDDTRCPAATGCQRLVPYIDVFAFQPDGNDIHMLIPSTSIVSMYCERYKSAP